MNEKLQYEIQEVSGKGKINFEQDKLEFKLEL